MVVLVVVVLFCRSCSSSDCSMENDDEDEEELGWGEGGFYIFSSRVQSPESIVKGPVQHSSSSSCSCPIRRQFVFSPLVSPASVQPVSSQYPVSIQPCLCLQSPVSSTDSRQHRIQKFSVHDLPEYTPYRVLETTPPRINQLKLKYVCLHAQSPSNPPWGLPLLSTGIPNWLVPVNEQTRVTRACRE